MKKILLFAILLNLTALTFSQTFPADQDHEFDHESKVVFPEMNIQIVENLELLGKIWGFLKYNHPKIGEGTYNWDYELFRILPSYLKSKSVEERDQILLHWISNLGIIDSCLSCKQTSKETYLEPDFSWLNDLNRSILLRKTIENIYHNRHQGKHYYISYDKYGNPSFINDHLYSDMPYPDAGYRLLALYRYWNYIQYFSPYRNLTDKNWNTILKENIPIFINAKTELEYETVALQLITETNDSHSGTILIGNKIAETKGKQFPPFKVRFIDNQLVVYEYYNPEKSWLTDLKIGDVITHISGKSVQFIIDSLKSLYPASNNASKLRDIAFNILRSDSHYIELQTIRNNQSKLTTLKLYPSDSLNLFPKNNEKCFQLMSGNVGYINLESIKKEDISVIKSTFKDTKGLIIDLRNGVSEYIPYSLGSFFVNEVTPFAKIARGNINNPGEFYFSEVPPLLPEKDPYKGKVVVLVNEFTQSMGEFTAMAFRAGINTTIIGSTTAGTDGTARQVNLPGNLKTMITGYGVFYPDGKQTQRVGIVPDFVIYPTIKGIKDGMDKVLEKAIEMIQNEE